MGSSFLSLVLHSACGVPPGQPEIPIRHPDPRSSPTYSVKAARQLNSRSSAAASYLLREKRLLFILIGAALASSFFLLQPYLSSSDRFLPTSDVPHRHLLPVSTTSAGRRVPGGLRRPPLRIVVTGGAGFVGSHLVDKLLARGDSVIVIDNFFTGRKENVVHHFQNPSEVYGDPLEHPQKETYWGNVNPIGVRSCYDEGKRTAETLTMDYHRGADVQVRIARIFNTYGPRMCIDDGRVVSNFVAQALRRQPLTVYGDGKQTRSFQYVSDLVDGLVALMESEHIGPFNLGNPGEFTMLELAEVVKETIDSTATIEFKPNTADDPHMRKPDITKAKELLNWEPKISLREGLPRMVTNFRQRILDAQS
ncbi:UDP-glucuronic acid decarboxylase 1 [Cocos nucifera]|uniref:UDP-glucuronate decarboxylase n=1 Tax=Cocos nucifera TaxID=13894 RepID=A0A8K0MZT0_COCNU|nr:UDP-glucuronic acid decarboxylase 1 [Cocos nucifera]